MRDASRGYLACLLVSLTGSCGGTEVGPLENPPPVVQAIEPGIVARGPSAVDVHITGLGFVQGAEARWNAQPRVTTYVDERHLTVTLTPADLMAPAGEIDVVNPAPGGGTSSSLTLVVAHPTPTLTGISPTQAPAVMTAQLTLQAQGSDFLVGTPSSVLRWNGIPLPTTVTSATEASAVVPDYLLRAGGSARITAANPAPGGGDSNTLVFDLVNPVPTVSSTDPAGVPVRTVADLEVLGTGFVHGATVWIDDTALSPSYVTATRLRVEVPAAATEGSTGLASLRVDNPAPGGGSSNSIDLAVFLAPPRIDALFPSRVFAGAADFTLLVTGADFDPAATVLWDGAPRSATIVNLQRIEVAVTTSDVAAEGTIEITVVNPGNAGHATAELTVFAPLSSGSVLLASRSGADELALTDLAGMELLDAELSHGAHQVDAAPVGTTAVYHSSGKIFQIDPYTAETQRLTPPGWDAVLGDEQWPRYGADGEWVYFMAAVALWEIWRVPAAGGTPEPVLSDSDADYGYPAVSHRGDRVTYTVGVSSQAELHVLDLTTGTSTPLGVEAGTSRWTTDDEWIVYWSWDKELRAIRPDGTGDRQITNGIQLASSFDLSPAGDRIVAVDETDGSAVLIDFATGAVTELSAIGSVTSMAWYGP